MNSGAQTNPSRRAGLRCELVMVGLLAWGLVACAPGQDDSLSQGGGARTRSSLQAPSRATFAAVGTMMQASCGTLDCHGQITRNLRLYGGRGLRLDPKGNPAEDPTTAREYDESYWSIVGLEPELTSAVVSDRGSWPARLTIIRKARGLEHHKGGTLWKQGDDRDACFVSWLAGSLNADACGRVKDFPAPQEPTTDKSPDAGP